MASPRAIDDPLTFGRGFVSYRMTQNVITDTSMSSSYLPLVNRSVRILSFSLRR